MLKEQDDILKKQQQRHISFHAVIRKLPLPVNSLAPNPH